MLNNELTLTVFIFYYKSPLTSFICDTEGFKLNKTDHVQFLKRRVKSHLMHLFILSAHIPESATLGANKHNMYYTNTYNLYSCFRNKVTEMFNHAYHSYMVIHFT